MDGLTIFAFQLIVLLFSVIVHEVSHGAVALALGDATAKDAGRLTLNPLKHLDFFGSIVMPISLYILSGGAFVLGWAKPVPFNPFRLKNPKLGAGLIGAAGPISNLIVASFFGLLLRLPLPLGDLTVLPTILMFFNFIIFINVLLAVFNLLPIPPLDGSNMLFSLLPKQFYGLQSFLERYGFFILIVFILFGFRLIYPIVLWLYQLIAGGQLVF